MGLLFLTTQLPKVAKVPTPSELWLELNRDRKAYPQDQRGQMHRLIENLNLAFAEN